MRPFSFQHITKLINCHLHLMPGRLNDAFAVH